MLKNAYLLAKIRADTAENEQNFAEILPKTDNYATPPAGRRHAAAALGNLGDWRGIRRVDVSFWQNFGKISLVFSCIKTKFCM